MDPKKPWASPLLRYVGTVARVLQVGNGKITSVTGDPGEPKKVPSTG
jgi:hypothetical protein